MLIGLQLLLNPNSYLGYFVDYEFSRGNNFVELLFWTMFV